MTTVDNRLDILITLYEDEKCRPQKLIDECLQESEYLMAHYHLQALYILNGRLQTLNNIANKYYDKKDSRKRTIGFLEERIESEGSDDMREYYKNVLRLAKEELDSLNSQINTSFRQFILF
ncbi:MAG TPA: hypothetical protein VK616_10795 [Flavitalea sp.]|nr:hypothetical protein [Flavitalea sp.]